MLLDHVLEFRVVVVGGPDAFVGVAASVGTWVATPVCLPPGGTPLSGGTGTTLGRTWATGSLPPTDPHTLTYAKLAYTLYDS